MPAPSRPRRGLAASRVATLLLVLGGGLGSAQAQGTPPQPAGPAGSSAARSAAEQGPTWASLTPAQRQALAPLQRDWQTIDAPRKSKWLEIAERYPKMTAQDQARLQARMNEWAHMTPQERTRTRQQYQGAKQVPQQQRQASWEAYQALPEDERLELANRARPAAAKAPLPAASGPAKAKTKSAPGAAAPAQQRLGLPTPDALQPKVNAVPAPGATPAPKPVAPSVVQARPGATTTLISKPAAPPAHQPSGMPKIAATPDYVDKKTLLPQTGPQSTASRRAPAAASAATARP
jgi:hypothetical protein